MQSEGLPDIGAMVCMMWALMTWNCAARASTMWARTTWHGHKRRGHAKMWHFSAVKKFTNDAHVGNKAFGFLNISLKNFMPSKLAIG
jgi:hypothetical protein